MKTTTIFSIIVLLLPCALTYAQSPESFFPYHVGDTWQYTLDNTNIIYQTDVITKDSTDSTGNVYLQLNNFSWYTYHLDISYNVYRLISGEDFYHEYELDAEIGDSWLWVPPQSDSIRAKIVDIYPDTIFGINTTVKEIEYWLFISQTDSLWLATRFLASGFGLIAFWGEPGPFYHLSGVVIDSVLYGFIVGIEEKKNHSTLPKEVELYQNYPNPFNPVSIIKYYLPVAAKVELSVYDLIGRKVNTLVNTSKPPGTYHVKFDGSQLSSGIYFYRLKINNKDVLAKKMILLK
jgi:hypothetical protein